MDNNRFSNYRERCGIASIPLMQVRHKSVVVYPEYVGRRSRPTHLEKPDFKQKKAYSGKVTAGVKKRITKAINVLLQVSKASWKQNPATGYIQYHRISFITLKITGDNITAREAYDNCMNHFLDWLTRTAGVKLYVWKVELTRAGQIHYHITCPNMISHVEIRQKWNSYLRKAGYLDDYAAQYGHYNANSTDIHSVNDIENLSSYIVKALCESIEKAEQIKKTRGSVKQMNIGAEMAKDVQNDEETDGKIWGCSEVLAAAHYVAFHMATRHYDYILHLEKEGKVKRFDDETGYWAVFHFADGSPPDILSAIENVYIEQHLNWQLSKPSKSSQVDDFEVWAKQMPVLNYKN